MMNVGSFMTQTASLCPSPAHFPSVWAHGHSLWPPHLFFLPTWVGLGPSRDPVSPWTLSSSGCYSLSIRLSRPASWDRIRHYRIQRLDNGWLYISPRLTFPSLQALVDHYSGMAFPCLCESRWDCGVLGEQTVCPYDTLPAQEHPDRWKRGHPYLHASPRAKKHKLGAVFTPCPDSTDLLCERSERSHSPTAVVLRQSPQWQAQFSPKKPGPELLLVWNSVDSQNFLVLVLQ